MNTSLTCRTIFSLGHHHIFQNTEEKMNFLLSRITEDLSSSDLKNFFIEATGQKTYKRIKSLLCFSNALISRKKYHTALKVLCLIDEYTLPNGHYSLPFSRLHTCLIRAKPEKYYTNLQLADKAFKNWTKTEGKSAPLELANQIKINFNYPICSGLIAKNDLSEALKLCTPLNEEAINELLPKQISYILHWNVKIQAENLKNLDVNLAIFYKILVKLIRDDRIKEAKEMVKNHITSLSLRIFFEWTIEEELHLQELDQQLNLDIDRFFHFCSENTKFQRSTLTTFIKRIKNQNLEKLCALALRSSQNKLIFSNQIYAFFVLFLAQKNCWKESLELFSLLETNVTLLENLVEESFKQYHKLRTDLEKCILDYPILGQTKAFELARTNYRNRQNGFESNRIAAILETLYNQVSRTDLFWQNLNIFQSKKKESVSDLSLGLLSQLDSANDLI